MSGDWSADLSTMKASRPSNSVGARIGRDIHDDIRRAEAARDAAGADIAIMIDAGFGYGTDASRAITVARELEPLDVTWLEEPFEPDAFEAYAQLADSVDLPIACGEQDSTWWGFRDVIERGHVDIVQPDVTRCGGLSEALRIAELARSRGVSLRSARLEERRHQGGVAPPERRAARGAIPGVLRLQHTDQQ